ncbi:EpsD family peptidyl-prolyl cis-trans isomerase [Thiobacillus sp.]
MTTTETAQARGKVLDALIDQHLVSSAAKNEKLDKIPEVALAMQQAQRQVLVEAYVERLFKDLPKPSDNAIRDYYNQHPDLFARRKLYRVQELELQLAPERVAEMEAQLKKSHSLAEFTAWLGTQKIAVTSGEVVRPAEKIPAVMLSQLVNMKNGQAVVVPVDRDRTSVLQLQDSQAQPLSLDQASDTIVHQILGEKRRTLLEAEIHKLRADGKIEYASGFVPRPKPVNASPPGRP